MPVDALPAPLASAASECAERSATVIIVDDPDSGISTSHPALKRLRSILEGFGATLHRQTWPAHVRARVRDIESADDAIGLVIGDDRLILIGASDDWELRLSTVADILSANAVRRWLEALGVVASDISVSTRYQNGADSLGIVLVHVDDRPIVAKTGPIEVIAPEFAFISTVNEELERRGIAPVFPQQLGIVEVGSMGVNLMEAVNPRTLDALLFSNVEQTIAHDGWQETLGPSLTAIGQLYSATLRPSVSQMARYAYLPRFEAIIRDQNFLRTFRSFFSKTEPDSLLRKSIHTPDDELIGGLHSHLLWLREEQDALIPQYSSLIHGDLHLKNLLTRADGTPVFVDPRTVWDGVRADDEGHGDPAYDFATLLHSVSPMSAILRAIDDGRFAAPSIDVGDDRDPLDATGTLAWCHDTVLREIEDDFVERLLALQPDEASAGVVRARLYVGAANALLGWLKYERALQSQGAWLSVYVHSMRYLERARIALERDPLPTAQPIAAGGRA